MTSEEYAQRCIGHMIGHPPCHCDVCSRVAAVFRTAILEERERCAKIAAAAAIFGHSIQASSCAAIAKQIREGL